ncbi:FtsQ-type POTRA domain-containing protein [candidate division TA06 bacterium]|uniref:FtsQ-type POTRA domain-containing protein n=1 Tax=candidate division TA06 bacterium TaxID=2250710 RepID=A0A933IC22_UNCT6|nr:FtsQ-type POTRA domain-containing protein [candidate division TA06 bacterium]
MKYHFDRGQAGRVRRREGRKKRVRLFAVLLILTTFGFGLSAGWTWVLKKGALKITAIEVYGQRLVPIQGITGAAAAYLGRPFWRVDEKEITKRLTQKYPAFKKVSVTAWPWGTLRLKVEERQAVAVLESDTLMAMDEEGVVFPDSFSGHLPRLRILGTTQPGRRRAINLITAAANLGREALVDPSDEENIKLRLSDRTLVHFGNGNFKDKYSRLEEVIKIQNNNGLKAAEIDLRFKDQAVISGQVAQNQAGQP